jgi:hypothetical protein
MRPRTPQPVDTLAVRMDNVVKNEVRRGGETIFGREP